MIILWRSAKICVLGVVTTMCLNMIFQYIAGNKRDLDTVVPKSCFPSTNTYAIIFQNLLAKPIK